MKKKSFARLSSYYQRHHKRYVEFTQNLRHRLTCQECSGIGNYTEIVDIELGGPTYECGWCEGTGLITPYLRGVWLRLKIKRKDGYPC